jgi:alpha-beta hydrolase superfamily lysophospholipase
MPWYQTSLLSLAKLTIPEMELTGDGIKVQATDNVEILKAMGRDPLIIKATRVNAIAGLVDLMDQAQNQVPEIRVPVLLIYGSNDQIIPKKPISHMLKKMAHHQLTRFSYIPDGYHLLLRDLNAAQTYKNIIDWISTPQNPLPYGETSRDELAKRLQSQE